MAESITFYTPFGERAKRMNVRLSRASIVVAYAIFILVGLSAGVGGVLALAQISDYGVSRSTYGFTFFTGSAGFVLASVTAGPLMHRFGSRVSLVSGGALFVVGAIVTAARPPFLALVFLQILTGYATGMLESALNAYLAAGQNATTLLNRLHAFFGVGALVGPVLATWLLGHVAWPKVFLVLAAVALPATVAAYLTLPARPDDPLLGDRSTVDGPKGAARLLPDVLKQPAVGLGAALLGAYIGLEIGVGTWGVGYLQDARQATAVLAGYTLSGYWLGLTVGRFVISPITQRLGMSASGLMYTCIAGVTAACALVWLVPAVGVSTVGFVVLGFFLGPIFPTTMAITQHITSARLAPTAMGVLNAGSVIGGSVLPWAEGAIGQATGWWTLLPVAFVLALAQLLVWWRLAARVQPAMAKGPVAETLPA